MAIECRVRDHQIIEVTHCGLVSVQSLIQAFIDLFSNIPAMRFPLHILWDCRHAETTTTDTLLYDAIDRSGELPQLSGARIAVIVSDDRQYGLARLSKVDLEMEALVVSVFRSIDEGLIWLQGHFTEA